MNPTDAAPPALAYVAPPDDGLDLVYLDAALLVVNKPAGLLSVPGRGEDKQDCLVRRVRAAYPEALIVHRLDLPTSGLLAGASADAARLALAPARYLLEQVVRPLFPSGGPAGAGEGWARVIPNILELDLYPYRHRPAVAPRLLWMRTFQYVYHPELAIDVLADVRRSHPTATMTMAGQDRGLREPLMELARERGLADVMRFPGFLDAAGKAREFAAHDIYLNTNRVDNMPVSVLEAGAFGLPVVATTVGGLPYLLRDGETGLLVPAEDAPAMAAAVHRLLDDPALAAALSANGRRLAESCGWATVRGQWAALFAEVCHA